MGNIKNNQIEQYIKTEKGNIKVLSFYQDNYILDKIQPIIEIKNGERIINGKTILSDVNLLIPKNSITIITGPSGAGKTTLSRIINGIDDFNRGELFIDGIKITKKNKKKLFKKTAFVFQNFNLFPNMNVLNNIIYTPIHVYKQNKDNVIKQAHAMLNKFGMNGYENAYPHSLSGGQKQRVAIIRALMVSPDVLIMDEPTASLDPELSNDVAKLIKDINKQGLSIVVVSHDLLFVKVLTVAR